MSLNKMAMDYVRILNNEKQLRDEKERLRSEMYRATESLVRENDWMIPITTVECPLSFFTATGLSHEEFIDTRFPGWTLENKVEKNNQITFVLKRVPELVQYVIEGDEINVSKTVVEYSPEIDWSTLQMEFPEIAERLSTERVVIELDEMALEKETHTNPEIFSILRRHMKVKKPTLKILQGKVKDGRASDEGNDSQQII